MVGGGAIATLRPLRRERDRPNIGKSALYLNDKREDEGKEFAGQPMDWGEGIALSCQIASTLRSVVPNGTEDRHFAVDSSQSFVKIGFSTDEGCS